MAQKPTLQLMPFQQDGVAAMRTRPRFLLGDDMGLGKSAQAIMAAEGRTLVLSTAMIHGAGVWTDEVAKWRPELDATCVSYSSLTQREKTGKGGSRPTAQLRPEYAGQWDTVILDEAHNIKGRHTTWALASLKLKCDRTLLLSGTPIPNWAHELFMPLRHLHPNDNAYTSFWRWAGEWFEVGRTKWSPAAVGDLGKWTSWDEFQRTNLGGLYLARKRDDVLTELPPLTSTTLEVDMVPAQRKVYNDLRRQFIAWLDSGETIEAWNKAALAVKLCKVSTGLELFGEKGSGKLDAVRELLASRPGPVFLACHFRDTAAALRDLCEQLGLHAAMCTGEQSPAQRGATVRAFQAGVYDVIIGTVDSISEGVPLTRANLVVMVEQSFRPSRNEQAIRRVHRMGQQRPVALVTLITRKSVDIRKQQLLKAKTDHQMAALSRNDLRELF